MDENNKEDACKRLIEKSCSEFTNQSRNREYKDCRDKSKRKRERSTSEDKHQYYRKSDRNRDRASRDRIEDYDGYRERKKKSEKDRERSKDSERFGEKIGKCVKDSGRHRGKDRLQERERRRSRSRTYDCDQSGKKSKNRSRRRASRSRSRSCDQGNSKQYGRQFDDEGSNTRECRGDERVRDSHVRSSKVEDTKEENRESRFDLTHTIHDLMNTSASTRNFATLFSCTNSNDSLSNGLSESSSMDGSKKSKRKSRWGGTENDKTFIPGMPTILPSTLDRTQQEAYLVQLQIEEISRKLRTGELGIPQLLEERSPSPEPIYSSDGKRLNTREYRFRKRLEEQRHQLIMRMQNVNPDFKPPVDYKPPVIRVSDKVLIPQEKHPDINFVGLLIGPRGNTLKAMEKETGAKIIIRGKGSVKEGKVGRKDGQPLPGEDEPLHAFITASNSEAVNKAVCKIKDVIRQGIEVPEGHNDLRRMQLRELAQLNGTLRETDCPRCTNCGSTEHKSWLCHDKPNITNSIVCSLCGGAGHISKDCKTKRQEIEGPLSDDSQAKIDEEYLSLMAELGEGPLVQKTTADPLAQAHLNRGYSLFDPRPSQPRAIAAPGPVTPQFKIHPSPIIPSSWLTSASLPHSTLMQPPLLPHSCQSIPPPTPPMMPWIPTFQPRPPSTESSNPLVGVRAPPNPNSQENLPIPSLLPAPPGTLNTTLPSWSTQSGTMHTLSWGQNGVTNYLQPPPPGAAPPPPLCVPLAVEPDKHGQLNPPPPPPPPPPPQN